MTQKELKEINTEELRKAWDSENMVKFCGKSTAYIIEHNGKLYGIDKPKIETRFCFGYGMYAVTSEEEETAAENMAEKAAKSKAYFINENLKDIDREIEMLRKILEDMGRNWAKGSHPRYMLETGAQYHGQAEDCKLRYYSVVDTFKWTTREGSKLCDDAELVEKLIAGYEKVKEDFIKRLNTYLKRYGMSKVKTWTYLRD